MPNPPIDFSLTLYKCEGFQITIFHHNKPVRNAPLQTLVIIFSL